MGHVKIDKKSDLAAAQFQVGEKLSLVNSAQFLHHLELHYYQVLDQEVDAITGIKSQSPVLDGQP